MILLPFFVRSIKVNNQPGRKGDPSLPRGRVLDANTSPLAVSALPVNFVRSPDRDGADNKGRYFVAVDLRGFLHE